MLRNAIASSSRGYAATAASEPAGTTCLVLGGVPRSALPSDMLLALQKAGALSTTTGKTITISNILKQPPTSSNYTSTTPLESSFHITFRSIEQARIARRQIEARGLFFNLRRVVDSRDSRHSGKRVTTVDFEKRSGQVWYREKMKRAFSEKSTEGTEGVGQVGIPDVTRIAPLDQTLRGKQVWLQGLPYKLTDQAVRTELKDFMISDLGGVIPLPSARGQHKSFIVTLPSISEAHRLIRKLHMQTWGSQYDADGKRNALVRAQVAW